MPTLEKAIQIAVNSHQGQKDNAGAPYILHPLRLMMNMDSDSEKIVAVLHDVLEDTSVTADQLRAEGFSDEIIAAIECLTRDEGESYEDFIKRTKGNPLARRVKLADIEDNMNIRRIRNITDQDLQRLERYHRAWRALSEAHGN
ncbi:MAG TPA: GTP pyrophosphokinase [Acidobacteriota bacterium]|nr:GTP pyrophosphokinase [Acidobacteriota bacterium]